MSFSPKRPIDFFQQSCYNRDMNTIKDFLHENGLTQGQVAELLGYTQNYVNQVANGKIKPTPAFRWRWLSAFGQPLEDTNGNVTNISTTTQRQEPQP